MGRHSDTRDRTREAAAELVASGLRPHQITVDRIYDVIRQGSRTTINEALKAWKAEQVKIEALEASLPPVVADHMRALWVKAVEQGEQTFAALKTKLEAQSAAAATEIAALRRELDERTATLSQLTSERDAYVDQVDELRGRLADAAASIAKFDAELASVRAQLDDQRQASATRINDLVAELDRRTREHADALTTQEAGFQLQLDTALTRLESVQHSMLQQVDDARTATRKAESRANEANTRLQASQEALTALRLSAASDHEALARERILAEKAAIRLADHTQEIAALQKSNAELRGRLAAQDEQLSRQRASGTTSRPVRPAKPRRRRA